MSADTEAPDARLTLPEGYVSGTVEGGRVAIYSTRMGAWIGELDPRLSNAQEVARDLIDAYEDERERLEAPIVLDFGTVAEDDLSEQSGEEAGERLTEGIPENAAQRIHDLERAASLAVEALRAAGDEANAEIVRAMLEESGSSRLWSQSTDAKS